jgi:hypothetical protein
MDHIVMTVEVSTIFLLEIASGTSIEAELRDIFCRRPKTRKNTTTWHRNLLSNRQRLRTARALVFEAVTWAAFEKSAQAQGKSAQQLISTAVAASLGTLMMDNYALNRWLKNDDLGRTASKRLSF